jgi:hypothetical protein
MAGLLVLAVVAGGNQAVLAAELTELNENSTFNQVTANVISVAAEQAVSATQHNGSNAAWAAVPPLQTIVNSDGSVSVLDIGGPTYGYNAEGSWTLLANAPTAIIYEFSSFRQVKLPAFG